MVVKGKIEGGGEFELPDGYVDFLRRYDSHSNGADAAIKAALPPEPYVPQVGDRVEYQEEDDASWWPDGRTSWAATYRGEVGGWHLLEFTHPTLAPELTGKRGVKLRKAGGA